MATLRFMGDHAVGRPVREVLAERRVRLADDHPPLPSEFHDPDGAPEVVDPVDEALVAVDHPRIAGLESYRAAGWSAVHPGTWLRTGAAERLYRVADALPERWGLAVFDAWRPLALQQELYHRTYLDPPPGVEAPPPGFLAEPSSDPRTPPPHLSGGTVDLTLTLDGIPLALGTIFDDFTPAAHTASLEAEPGPERTLRRQLYWAMRAEGFVVLHQEWWHFEWGTRRWAAITGGVPVYGAAPSPAAPSTAGPSPAAPSSAAMPPG